MDLPRYFLADLPADRVLTATLISEACATLKRNREKFLASRSTSSLVQLLCDVGAEWRNVHYPLRKMALDASPSATGFGRVTLETGLDTFFRRFVPDEFHALIEQDLGRRERLDQFCGTECEVHGKRSAMASGPGLLAHIAAGNLPVPAFMSLVLGLLTRSAQFIKCSSGRSLLPRLFAHSIYQVDAKVGACLEVAEWPGGDHTLETALFEAADGVTATGSDRTLASVALRVPERKRFLGYGQQVSFAYITRHAAASGVAARQIAEKLATDVAAWNQFGCLSPHVIYLESGSGIIAEQFGELLQSAMSRLEESNPRGELRPEEAAEIMLRRSCYAVRAANLPDTRCWGSLDSTAWTIVYEGDPAFHLSCLNRFVYLKVVKDLDEVFRNAAAFQGMVSTVGLAANHSESTALAAKLARWGVKRVCPPGRMQDPPLAWRHDGRPALGDLITWTDYEAE